MIETTKKIEITNYNQNDQPNMIEMTKVDEIDHKLSKMIKNDEQW